MKALLSRVKTLFFLAIWSGNLSPFSYALKENCKRSGGVNLHTITAESSTVRNKQDELTCSRNFSDVLLFRSKIRAELKEGNTEVHNYNDYSGFYTNTNISCRKACPGSEVSWCVHVYHPTEQIKICVNQEGILNATEYASLLHLECFFSMNSGSNSIMVQDPKFFLEEALLVCSTRSNNCSSVSTSRLKIIDVGQEEPAKASIVNGTSADLVLNRTNIFLCIAEFNNLHPFSNFGSWYMNGMPIALINEDPYCESDCNRDTLAKTRGDRIRSYRVQYGEKHGCSRSDDLHLHYLWLVIDEAEASDTNRTFYCKARSFSFLSGYSTKKTDAMSLMPVLPLVEVVVVEVPDLSSGSGDDGGDSLQLLDDNQTTVALVNEQASFQWTCSVQAGAGDELAWLHNGIPVPLAQSASQENVSCSDMEPDSLSVVQRLSDQEGLLTVVLLACGLSPHKGRGLYECRLNRSRGVPVAVWSARVPVPEKEEEVMALQSSTSPAPSASVLEEKFSSRGPAGGKGSRIDLVLALLAVLVLLVVIIIAFLVWVLRANRRYRRNSSHNGVVDATHTFGFPNTSFETKADSRLEDGSLEVGVFNATVAINGISWSFPFERLHLTNVILGEGTFGRVVQALADGIVENEPQRNLVAVKSCRESLFRHEVCLREELQVMMKLKPHDNIVNLLGYSCSPDGALHLIIEYAVYGNLKDFLQEYQTVSCGQFSSGEIKPQGLFASPLPSLSPAGVSTATFSLAYSALREKIPLSLKRSISSSTSGVVELELTSRFRESCQSVTEARASSHGLTSESGFSEVGSIKSVASTTYQHASCGSHHCDDRGGGGEEEEKDVLHEMETVQFQDFCLQIARGLQHLESLNIVHCDLASRNILIAEGFLLKIADFGLARETSDDGCYVKSSEGKIPVKWTAPEALSGHIFTHYSDVWSYGVTLWEIFSYGHKPYSEQNIGLTFDSFIRYLVEGNRLPQPVGCPNIFYQLMTCCWQLEPGERPTATDLVGILTGILNCSLASSEEEASPSQVNAPFVGSSQLPVPAEEALVPSCMNGGPFLQTATSHFMYPKLQL